MQSYYCLKCKRFHLRDSHIGFDHLIYCSFLQDVRKELEKILSETFEGELLELEVKNRLLEILCGSTPEHVLSSAKDWVEHIKAKMKEPIRFLSEEELRQLRKF